MYLTLQEDWKMKHSKLEEYLKIIAAITKGGSIDLSNIALLTNIEHNKLMRYLSFLVDHKYLNKNSSSGSEQYVASSSGIRILEFFYPNLVNL